MGMCGDDFWDALVSQPDVTKTCYNWAAAQELRQGAVFEAMRLGHRLVQLPRVPRHDHDRHRARQGQILSAQRERGFPAGAGAGGELHLCEHARPRDVCPADLRPRSE